MIKTIMRLTRGYTIINRFQVIVLSRFVAR